jgi:hypothetical protein
MGLFAAMRSGLGLTFFAAVALNLLCGAVLVFLILLSLPLHLWRAAEVISALVARHLLPFGVRFRYRSWQLRRLARHAGSHSAGVLQRNALHVRRHIT